jgi:hypothetical protein
MDISDQIEARAAALAIVALDDVYKDSFWDERFGARGRRFAAEDGNYHVTYLVESLRAKNPEPLVRYARWLQSVLTSRGMCSRHLDDHFESLARAIANDPIDAPEEALRFIASAREALVYDHGPQREVQLAAPKLAQRATEIMEQRRSLTAQAEADRAMPTSGFDYILSYLADAIALQNPRIFADHLRWLAGALERRAAPRSWLDERLLCLEEAAELLSPEARTQARAQLAEARAQLAKDPA